jgi:exonuclease VII small subunit
MNDMEKLLQSMESGDLSLEESINSYHLLITSLKQSFDTLNVLSQRITLLKQEGDAIFEAPYNNEHL